MWKLRFSALAFLAAGRLVHLRWWEGRWGGASSPHVNHTAPGFRRVNLAGPPLGGSRRSYGIPPALATAWLGLMELFNANPK